MPTKIGKKYLLIAIIVLELGAISVAAVFMFSNGQNKAPAAVNTEEPSLNIPEENTQSSTDSVEIYKGVSTSVANQFSIKVPNGWKASISEDTNFLAIMFARPNQLESLVYSADSMPFIDRDGIPPWSGLTEHFFIIKPTADQVFNPNDHLEVSSHQFSFDDGTIGQSYYVVKHIDEAKKWGGLQKDAEWQGRTYIYEKDGTRVEAHLALYPSTEVSLSFFESVIRTLSF